MAIFSLAYLLRSLWDILPQEQDKNTFRDYMIDLLLGIPFDIVPILLILLFHRRNLKLMALRQNRGQNS